MRRRRSPVREIIPDARYNSIMVTKLINSVMLDGKKSIIEKAVYGAFDMSKVNAIQSANKMANPNALLLANAAFDAVMKIGWPEGRIPLAEATVYLATSPKSNSAYEGINNALELVGQTGNLPVPLHLRNAPTKLMKQLGYGKDYKYAHSYENHFIEQQFLPDELKNNRIWYPQNNAQEIKIKDRMIELWGERFKK